MREIVLLTVGNSEQHVRRMGGTRDDSVKGRSVDARAEWGH